MQNDKFYEHIKSLYNNELLCDFIMEDDNGEKVFLNKCVISIIPFFRRFFETKFDDDKAKMKVPSIKSVIPILKNAYRHNDAEIIDELKQYSATELIDFFLAVDYYGATELYIIATHVLGVNLRRIILEDVDHYSTILMTFSSIFKSCDRESGIDKMNSYILGEMSQDIDNLPEKIIGSDLFYKMPEYIQLDLILIHKRYELIDSYIDHINIITFGNAPKQFKDLCSHEQYSRLHGDWSKLDIKSIFPEFVLHIKKDIGRVESSSRSHGPIIIRLRSSSLSLGEHILIGEDKSNPIEVKKIFLEGSNTSIEHIDVSPTGASVDKIYPSAYYSVILDKSNDRCYHPGETIYKLKTIYHKYSST